MLFVYNLLIVVINSAVLFEKHVIYENVSSMKIIISVSKQRRNRTRKMIWCNQPYSRNVSANIGRQFLMKKNSRKTILRIRYSMETRLRWATDARRANVKQIIIEGQNKTLLKQTVSVPDEKTWNCIKPKKLPCSWTTV